jgi:hypothetical protein
MVATPPVHAVLQPLKHFAMYFGVNWREGAANHRVALSKLRADHLQAQTTEKTADCITSWHGILGYLVG